MEKYNINIAKDYSQVLGGRLIIHGDFSGEDFYNKILFEKFLAAQKEGVKLYIELDGTKGYPSSFLDQSFGELARNYGVEVVRSTIVFSTKVFQWIVDYINKEIWDKTK